MIKERVTVNFDEESYYLDGEYWESWDSYGEEMAEEINKLLDKQDKRIKNLEEENKELREDNDIKFWKLQCMHYFNTNSLFISEISRAIKKGYVVSEPFQKYLDELEKDSKKIKEKNERLFGDSDD